MLDWLTFPDHAATLIAIRMGLTAPIVLAPFLLTFTRWHWIHYQRVCLLAPASAGLSIVVMMLVTRDGYTSEYFNGLVVVSVYGYAFIRLQFLPAALANQIFWIAFALAEVFVFEFPLPVVIGHAFFAVGTNVIGLASAYSLDKGARESFAARISLVEENRKSEELLLSILPDGVDSTAQ